MVEQKRVKLTIRQALTHYSIVWFFLVIPGVIIYDLIKVYITNTFTEDRSPIELIKTIICYIVIAIFLYFIQWRRLRFSIYKIPHSEDNFEEAFKMTVKELDWKVAINQRNYKQATTPSSILTGSWGERITIINDGNRFLINSICDPDKRPSVSSFGWNKKNVRTFLETLKSVTNQVPQKIDEPETPEKEWTLKKIVIRLFAYPFCIFLIIFGLYELTQPISFKGIIAMIGGVIIASIYLYEDLKIITKNTSAR
jgi:hypothetical protein